jgi:hypothetical protein
MADFHRELSNGHFSDDNQKRLNGPSVEVPIYEAKMTRDQRLVVSCISGHPSVDIKIYQFQYQVDCIPEYNSDVSPLYSVIKLLL